MARMPRTRRVYYVVFWQSTVELYFELYIHMSMIIFNLQRHMSYTLAKAKPCSAF